MYSAEEMLKTFLNLEDTSNLSPILVESNAVPSQTIEVSSEFNSIDAVVKLFWFLDI